MAASRVFALLVFGCQYSIALSATPNFIIFQPDDMPFYDTWSPPGNAPSKMNRKQTPPSLPHMTKVRSDGASFTNAYVVSPACGTSRWSTLTGKYPSRSEYGRSKTLAADAQADRTKTTIPFTKLTATDKTQNIPAALKAAGYRTGVTGKWHLQDAGNRASTFPSYAESQTHIQESGFDYADGIYVENIGGTFAGTGSFTHNMEWMTEKAVEFIEGTPASQPFFMYFNPTVPHVPSVLAALNGGCTESPKGSLPSEPQVVGMTTGTTCASYRDTVKSRGGTKEADLGSVWSDDALGVLMDTLTRKGILDNTVVIVMMDHGIETKMALFENGARIALSMRYPPLFTGGMEYNGHVTNLDIGKTILDLAGVSSPGWSLDGTSFRSDLEGIKLGGSSPDYWTTRCLFFEYEKDRAVRCGCYKLISIGDSSASTTITRAGQNGYSQEITQLYNLCTDSSEATLLSDPGITQQMQTQLTCHLQRTAPGSTATFSVCGAAPPTSSVTSAGAASSGGMSTSGTSTGGPNSGATTGDTTTTGGATTGEAATSSNTTGNAGGASHGAATTSGATIEGTSGGTITGGAASTTGGAATATTSSSKRKTCSLMFCALLFGHSSQTLFD